MSVAKLMLPRFMVLQIEGKDCVKYASEREVVWGEDESVFNIFAKIEVELGKSNDDYFHLRFCHTNKYLARGQYADDGLLVADSNEPEEDTSKPSCTLFSLSLTGTDEAFYIKHVQSGRFVSPTEPGSLVHVYDYTTAHSVFTRVDWETLVKLPKHVALRVDNARYLKGIWAEGHPYFQFSSDDPNEEDSGHEVSLLPDGHVRVKSGYFGKFWRRTPNWVWGDVDDNGDSSNLDTHFWPVKINETSIALQARVNQKFVKRFTVNEKISYFNSSGSTINQYAAFVLKELVLERKIYGVKYRMKDARIYDQKPYLAGTATATNEGDEEACIAVEITYEDEKSYSFGRSLSMMGGVNTTIEANVMGIDKGAIAYSYSVSGAFEWNKTTTTTKTVTATGSVFLPARTTAVIRYTGSMGTCSIPFSYMQQDKSSTDGTIVVTNEIDGIFTGVNYYDFNFEFAEKKAL